MVLCCRLFSATPLVIPHTACLLLPATPAFARERFHIRKFLLSPNWSPISDLPQTWPRPLESTFYWSVRYYLWCNQMLWKDLHLVRQQFHFKAVVNGRHGHFRALTVCRSLDLPPPSATCIRSLTNEGPSACMFYLFWLELLLSKHWHSLNALILLPSESLLLRWAQLLHIHDGLSNTGQDMLRSPGSNVGKTSVKADTCDWMSCILE